MELQSPFAALAPTVDGDVLQVLASSYDEFTVARLATLLPHRSPNGIRNVAERLVVQGTLTARDAGRTRTYALNDAHLVAHAIREIAAVSTALVKRLGDAVTSWVDPPVYGAVFGSAARREMREDSDLDILLVRPSTADAQAWEHNLATLTRLATSWTGNDARIVDLDEIDLNSVAHRPLLEAVVAEGVTFAGDSGWLSRAIRARVRE